MKFLTRILSKLPWQKRMIIIQLPLTTHFGQEDEMQVRDELAAALDKEFESRDCGMFDGTDAGMGKTNLYIYDIPADRRQEAVALSMSEIERLGLKDTAIVASGLMDRGSLEVVWPNDFEGEFSVL